MPSPEFTGRQWAVSSERRAFRRSQPPPAACVSTPFPALRGSPSSQAAPEEEEDASPACSMCSPVFHGMQWTSPIGKIEEKNIDEQHMRIGASMLKANAWLSHNIVSPASFRLSSTKELAEKQNKSPKLDLKKNSGEEAIEEECDILAAIGSRLEDEEELSRETDENAQSGILHMHSDEDFVVSAGGIIEATFARDKAGVCTIATPLPFSLHSARHPSLDASNHPIQYTKPCSLLSRRAAHSGLVSTRRHALA